MESRSVHSLVTQLCETIPRQQLQSSQWHRAPVAQTSRQLVKSLRAKSFAILLSNMSVPDAGKEEDMDAVAHLMAYSLTLSWRRKRQQSERLDECIKELMNKNLHQDPVVNGVLRMLVQLMDEGPPRRHQQAIFHLDRPKPSQDCAIVPYREYPASEFQPSDVMLQYSKFGQYIPPDGTYAFDEKPGKGLPLLSRFLEKPTNPDGSSAGALEYNIPKFPVLRGRRDIDIPKRIHHVDQNDEGYSTDVSRNVSPSGEQPAMVVPPVLVNDAVWELALNVKLPRYRTWESLGDRDPPREPPFLTESPAKSAQELWSLCRMGRLIPDSSEGAMVLPLVVPEMRVVSRLEFVHEVKYLLVGIETASFRYCQEVDGFEMVPGTCVEGITPEAFAVFVGDFLLCGTYFKRLHFLVTPSPVTSRLAYEGLIFHALCESIRRYLQFYRGAVLLHPAQEECLHALVQWLQGLKHQLAGLARLCCVDGSSKRRLPEGIALVSYLYEELDHTTRQDVRYILCSALRSCSQVYFRFLQKWIFEGVSQDAYEEFFIQVMPRMGLSRCRKYWTNCFELVNSAVPGFLRGYENAILQCGKTINLLKLCSPQDPLCIALQSGYPTVRCCLQNADLQRLQRECDTYERRVREIVGEPVTTAGLYQRSQAQEQAFHETIRQVQEKRLLKLKLEREVRSQQQAQEKQKQLAELRHQMQLVQDRRAEERERELREDAELLERSQRLEREDTTRKEEEKKKLVEYYEELSAVVEKRRHHAEWRIERLRLHSQRAELLTSEHQHLAEINSGNVEHPASRSVLERIEEVAGSNEGAREAIPADTSREVTREVTVTVEDAIANNTENFVNYQENQAVSTTQDNRNDNNNSNLMDNDINQNMHYIIGNNTRDHHILDMSNDYMELDNAITLKPVSLYGPDELIESSRCMTENNRETRLAAQRTRAKVLGEEFAIDVPKYKREPLEHVQTYVSKNRWKMLHGDVNIITGTPRSSHEILEKLEMKTSMEKAETESIAEEMSTSMSLEEPKSEVDGTENVTEPMSTSISLEEPKLESASGSNAFKSGVSSAGATPGASKASSSYNIASLTSSSSFDLCSGKLSLNIDTPTTETSVADDVLKSENLSSQSVKDRIMPFTFWMSNHMRTLGSEDLPSEEMGSNASEERELDEVVVAVEPAKGANPLDLSMINVALQKSVVIPLQTQTRLANEAIIKYFLVQQELLSHLNSLRSYFFLLDGEFGRNLTNALFQRATVVQQPGELLNYMALSNILANALTASMSGGERNAELLTFNVNSVPEHFRIASPDVFQCLSLQYRVAWPLNIIITTDALRHYDKIFAFLLKVRRVSWVLEEEFHRLKRAAGGSAGGSQQYHHVQLWRHEMTMFIRAIQNYITSTVLQSCWIEFQRDLNRAQTLEDLYRTHVAYIKKVLFRCLLFKQSRPVHGVLMQVFTMILKFHAQLGAAEWRRSARDGTLEHPRFDMLTKIYNSYRSLARFLYQFVLKLAKAGYQPHLFELLEILNVNSYYQE